MIKRIFRATTLVILSGLLTFSIFPGSSSAENIPMYENNYNDNALGIVIEPINEKKASSNSELGMDEESMKELFGDEQVFPFAAGLDSY